jgi:hypothetical protein
MQLQTARNGWSPLPLEEARMLVRQRFAGVTMIHQPEIDAMMRMPAAEFQASYGTRWPEPHLLTFWQMMRPQESWPSELTFAVSLSAPVLRGFARDVAADGGVLTVVYVPHPYQIGPAECSLARYFQSIDADVVAPADSGLQGWLRQTTAASAIRFLDPTEAMRQRSSESDPLNTRMDCHWSVSGHAFMASWLAQQLNPPPAAN